MTVNSLRLLPATRVLLFACLVLLAIKSTAQTPAPSPSPAPTPPPAQTSAAPPLVKLNVIVTDAAKHTVAGLRAEDFRVTEDGVPQTLTVFAGDTAPVSYGLVVDNSGSVRPFLSYVIAMGKEIVTRNLPEDETTVIRFVSSDKIERLTDFTASTEQLVRGLEQMYVEGGQTAITDAVYLTAQRLAAHVPGDDRRRRAIVLLSDGEDRASYYKQETLINLLRRESVQVFPIGITEGLMDTPSTLRLGSREKAIKYVNTLAAESGGRAFIVKDVADLKAAVEQVAELLHQQYVLGYAPTNVAPDGKYRKVEVKLNEPSGNSKRTVTTRLGYTAPGTKDK